MEISWLLKKEMKNRLSFYNEADIEFLPATKALIKALKSDTVKKYINDKYDGAVVPLF